MSLKAFTCHTCQQTYQTDLVVVEGKRIEQWWQDRGQTCTTCLGLASATTVHQRALTERPGKATIQERFEAFHADNPWVLTALVELIVFLQAKGRRKLGIGMLWEHLRWQVFISTTDASSGFKLNDHYRSRYVRLLVEQHPEFAGLFELRELRAA